MAIYHLPNHFSQITNDPLGLTDSSEENIAVWPILTNLLGSKERWQTPGEFIELLETIAYTVHVDPHVNFGCLKKFLQDIYQQDHEVEYLFSSSDVISCLLELALDLPVYFPKGVVDILVANEPRTFTRKALGVLLAHQALGTLKCPVWNDWGGVNLWQWYSDTGGQESSKIAYMGLSFGYICKLAKEPADSIYANESVEFHLHIPQDLATWRKDLEIPLVPLTVCELKIEDDLPANLVAADDERIKNCLVVSCHPLVGHGPSATQEERIVASYPELLPISIMTPQLGSAASVVVKSAGSKFSPQGRLKGHGRTAELMETYDSGRYNETRLFNTFIFIDASQRDLEADSQNEDKLMELDAEKAYSGFLAALMDSSQEHVKLFTPPWGAGAFGGNLLTNLRMLWVGASVATAKCNCPAELVFLVKNGLLEGFDPEWKTNFEQNQRDLSASRAWDLWHTKNSGS